MKRASKIFKSNEMISSEQNISPLKIELKHMNHMYKNILVLVLVMIISQSCSVFGLIESTKKVAGDYTVEIKPISSIGAYDMSINVVQGITSYEKGWFTAQTSANKFLSINYLNAQGESIYNIKLNAVSHGQDLSVEKVNESLLYLYTTSGHFNKPGDSGLLRLKVDLPEMINGKIDMSKILVSIDEIVKLELDNCTPTISEDKQEFAIRTGNSILVASKNDVLKGDLSKASKFDLDKSQLVDSNKNVLWFQGIAMKNDKIFCLTGNNSFNSPKYIYVYNRKGEVVKSYHIDKEDYKDQLKYKLEPESLTFVGDDLYYTIMLKGKTGGNRKLLHKLELK